jgi:hypothetical protein
MGIAPLNRAGSSGVERDRAGSDFANLSSISFSEGGGYVGQVERELKTGSRKTGNHSHSLNGDPFYHAHAGVGRIVASDEAPAGSFEKRSIFFRALLAGPQHIIWMSNSFEKCG